MHRLIVIATLALLGASGTCRGIDPFADAAVAPPDTTVYLHVRDAAGLREHLAGRPLLDWIETTVGAGQLKQAWHDLAARADLPPAKLFDACLGRHLTYLGRAGGQWAVVSELDPARGRELETKLRLRPLGPRGAFGVGELPEQALLLARNHRTLVIGPRHATDLFEEILDRLSEERPDRDDTMLAMVPAETAGDLGGGRVAVLFRHPMPLGGWSAVVAEVSGDRLKLRHASKFENDPLTRRITAATCDFSPLAAFEGKTLLAFAEPTDVGDGVVENYLMLRLGMPLLGPALRENIGDRRFVAVGEEEGRLLRDPQDILATSVAICVEVKEPGVAGERLDRHLEELAARVEHMGQGAFLVDVSDAHPALGCEPRCIDVSGATEWFTGGFPVMRNITLNWTIAHGPETAWCVIATHRGHLDDVTRCLESPPAARPEWQGRFDNVGIAAGQRIGGHLRSWRDHAAAFDPQDAEAFRQTIDFLSTLAEGVDTCRWTMSRPAVNEMRLNVDMTLAGPKSAGQ